MIGYRAEARAFAESVAGALERCGAAPAGWSPGEAGNGPDRDLAVVLDELGWGTLAHDVTLAACAGLGAVELGRRLAPLHLVDQLLGGGPMAGELVRSLGVQPVAIVGEQRVTVCRAERVPSAEGLDVWRVAELGEVLGHVDASAVGVWRAALLGYLAGLGEGALNLTVGYAAQRRAFGSTLAGLAPVQQLLAEAATAVQGIKLLAAEDPGVDALAHAGPAIAGACAACQQVTGAIGFTLEYPLHRYTQRARALAIWSDA
jgi:hypothetical protein